MTKQIGRNVGIACERVIERPAGAGTVVAQTEEEQGFGPAQVGTTIVFMFFEKEREFAVASEFEQAGGQDIANALVIVRIEAEQVAPVRERVIVLSTIPQGLGETGAGTHVGTGFEEAPEMTDVVLECFLTEHAFAGFDAFAV
jgi:hypothetical protein